MVASAFLLTFLQIICIALVSDCECERESMRKRSAGDKLESYLLHDERFSCRAPDYWQNYSENLVFFSGYNVCANMRSRNNFLMTFWVFVPIKTIQVVFLMKYPVLRGVRSPLLYRFSSTGYHFDWGNSRNCITLWKRCRIKISSFQELFKTFLPS